MIFAFYDYVGMQKLEQQLIKKIVLKDEAAFDMLFQAYYHALIIVASGILKDNGLAEEVVQDVFIKLWKTGSELSINTSLSAYLIRMVRNRSIDCLRAKMRQVKTVSIDSLEIQTKLHELGLDPTFEGELFSEPLEISLKRTLEQLSPQCKQIFKLNRFDGYAPDEIAKMLQISISTVKTQISRALQKMKEAVPINLRQSL